MHGASLPISIGVITMHGIPEIRPFLTSNDRDNSIALGSVNAREYRLCRHSFYAGDSPESRRMSGLLVER